MGSGVDSAVAEGVAVGSAVAEEIGGGSGVAEEVGGGSGVDSAVAERVAVGVGGGSAIAEEVGVGSALAERVAVGVGVGSALAERVAVGVGVGSGAAEGVDRGPVQLASIMARSAKPLAAINPLLNYSFLLLLFALMHTAGFAERRAFAVLMATAGTEHGRPAPQWGGRFDGKAPKYSPEV